MRKWVPSIKQYHLATVEVYANIMYEWYISRQIKQYTKLAVNTRHQYTFTPWSKQAPQTHKTPNNTFNNVHWSHLMWSPGRRCVIVAACVCVRMNGVWRLLFRIRGKLSNCTVTQKTYQWTSANAIGESQVYYRCTDGSKRGEYRPLPMYGRYIGAPLLILMLFLVRKFQGNLCCHFEHS